MGEDQKSGTNQGNQAAALQAERGDHFKAKELWKQQPGNRYTADEVREIIANLNVHEFLPRPKRPVFKLD